MKKLISTLTLTALSFSAFSATTATLNLKGIIEEKMSIEVQNNSLATSLDLLTPKTNFKIAEVVEKSNRKAGYKVAITSANGGKLKNGALDEIAYTLSYGGQALLLNGSDVQTRANTQALGSGAVKDVAISYTAQNEVEKVSGDYTDTVTFVISAN